MRAQNTAPMTFWQELGWVLKNFILGQLLIAALDALTAWLGLAWLGIPHAPWLGLFVGLMSFVPYAGPILGFTPPLILAWTSQHDWRYLLGVLGLWLVLQLLEGLVFQPKILGDKLKLHPLLVMLSFLAWGLVLGPVGVVLAVPLTAVAQIVWRRWRARFRARERQI